MQNIKATEEQSINNISSLVDDIILIAKEKVRQCKWCLIWEERNCQRK